MEQIKIFSDERHNLLCTYCGDTNPDTRDHVPSKVLLDEPFPQNLPIVPCCNTCNYNFSLDEEYFACAIECIVCGTAEIDKLNREKIKRSLLRNPQLRAEIKTSFIEKDRNIVFKFDEKRFKNVIIKLAKGHTKFEHSSSRFETPNSLSISALNNMNQDQLNAFFQSASNNLEKSPEVGSRAYSKVYINHDNAIIYNPWEVVQEGRYKYSVNVDNNRTIVKILLSNYLAVVVIWE